MSLPLCDVVVCYANDHDLGPGWSCLPRNILSGYALEREGQDDTITEDGNASASLVTPESYVYYRRRQPCDKLVWSPKHLQLGDLLDVKDPQQNWCFATVIDTNQYDELKIHYTRWTSTFDEWIKRSDKRRLAEYGTKSTEETTITRGKQNNTTVSLIQPKIDRLGEFKLLLSGAPFLLYTFSPFVYSLFLLVLPSCFFLCLISPNTEHRTPFFFLSSVLSSFLPFFFFFFFSSSSSSSSLFYKYFY